MKNRKGLWQIVFVIIIVVIAIKFVPPVNNWARGNLPEPLLTVLGEKPKSVFERGSDFIGDSLKKGSNLVDDLVDKVKK